MVAALWLGYPDMGLLPWVGVVFGGIVLVMMVLPRNWQRWRLAELAWDERHLYLLNGGEDRALALPRAVLVGMERDRKVGHDGQWLDFSLDLGLDEVTLATATSLLGLSRKGLTKWPLGLSIRVQTCLAWASCPRHIAGRAAPDLTIFSTIHPNAQILPLIRFDLSCSDNPRDQGLGIRSWKCHGMMPWLVRQGLCPYSQVGGCIDKAP